MSSKRYFLNFLYNINNTHKLPLPTVGQHRRRLPVGWLALGTCLLWAAVSEPSQLPLKLTAAEGAPQTGQTADGLVKAVTAYEGNKRDDQFKALALKNAKALFKQGDYQRAMTCLDEYRAVDKNSPEANYYAARAAYEVGRLGDAAYIGRRYLSENKARNIEILKQTFAANIRLNRFGPGITDLNWGLQKKLIREDQWYFESVGVAYSKMGGRPGDILRLVERGLAKYQSPILLDLAADYAWRNGLKDKAKEYGKQLEPFIYAEMPQAETTLDLNRLWADSKTAVATLRQPSSRSYGRSKFQVWLWGNADRKKAKEFDPGRIGLLRNEDFPVFGRAVHSPMDGLVVETTGSRPDLAPGQIDFNHRGNYIIVMIQPGEYIYFGNLRSGSLAVETGQFIPAGTKLAEVGHSGPYLFPGLAFEQRNRAQFLGKSIPVGR